MTSTTSPPLAAPARKPQRHAAPDAAPPLKNQEWHTVVEDLVAGGKTTEEARCMLTNVLALHTLQTLHRNAREHLSVGHDTNAAMFTIAVASLRDLPKKLETAGADQEKAREAVASARARLKSSGSLLDMLHPSGRQPILHGTDDILADFEEFLGTGISRDS